jgi:hypothetical protein
MSQQQAFDDLKQCLFSSPVLSLSDLQQPFEIEINASDQSVKVDLVLYNSRHDQSAMGIDPMNNISIIIRIHFAITLFQHSPLTRRVFYNSIRKERGLHHQQHQEGSIINIILEH